MSFDIPVKPTPAARLHAWALQVAAATTNTQTALAASPGQQLRCWAELRSKVPRSISVNPCRRKHSKWKFGSLTGVLQIVFEYHELQVYHTMQLDCKFLRCNQLARARLYFLLFCQCHAGYVSLSWRHRMCNMAARVNSSHGEAV